MKLSHAYLAIAAAAAVFPGSFNGVHASQDTKTALPITQHGQPLAIKDFVRSGTARTKTATTDTAVLGVSSNQRALAHLGVDQVAKLVADDNAVGDRFGFSVSVSGETVVVGAQGDDDNGDDSGSAYIFANRNQVAKLVADDNAVGDRFGSSVSVSGEIVVVGARYDDDNGGKSGSAYVFAKIGTDWNQVAKLVANDGAAFDYFGASVSVSGETVVVGAFLDDTDKGSNSGSAYVFAKIGTDWNQVAKLVPDDGAANDQFGISVSVSGETVVVGADGDDDNGSSSGSAYVFAKIGTDWNQVAKLVPDDGAAFDYFGASVSVSGETVVVGSRYDGDKGESSGSAYVFAKIGTDWNQVAKLVADDSAAGDYFGWSVSVSGETVVVGAANDDDNGDISGSAYVFANNGTDWNQITKLVADDAAANDRFGFSVSVSGETVVVGAQGDALSGSAYVFANNPGPWTTSPTKNPTSSPSSSQITTPGPWEVEFLDMVANFAMTSVISSAYQLLDGLEYSQCPEGLEVAEDECLAAGNALTNGWSTITNRDDLGVNDWGDMPCGCFIWGDRLIDYDTNCGNAMTNSGTQLICKSSKVDEITATYHVGSGRTYNTVLYQKGCKSKEPITDIDITSTPSAQLFNSTFDTLTVSHSIDKSQIASSTQIWNSTSNKLEVCQVVELKEGNMVVITNEYELAIDFNLVVDYATGDATLQQAQTESDVVNTTVDDYISAFKCDGEDFGASNTAHLENTQLNICIESESTEVVIDKIQTMTLTQVVDGAADKSLDLINNSIVNLAYIGFASKTFVTGKGFYVTTLLPSSTFSYTGNPITVSGKVELRLANGRKLAVNIDSVIGDAAKDRSLQVDDEQSASFDVDVALKPQVVDEDEAIMNSAPSTTGMQVFAGLVFALVYSMMY